METTTSKSTPASVRIILRLGEAEASTRRGRRVRAELIACLLWPGSRMPARVFPETVLVLVEPVSTLQSPVPRPGAASITEVRLGGCQSCQHCHHCGHFLFEEFHAIDRQSVLR